MARKKENEALCRGKTYLILTTHVPHSEAYILVLHRLHVKADSGNSCHNLTQLELVQNGGFTCSVKTHHENSHLLFAKKAGEQLHVGGGGERQDEVRQEI